MPIAVPSATPRPALPSATLMLLRCARGGIEVLMLKRPARAAFGGAWVFPGGTLDAADRDNSLYRRCLGVGDAHASRALSVPRDGLAYWIAAIRETFEETGVLMAVNGCGQGARAAPGARKALIEGRAVLAGLCRLGNWRLPARRLHYVAHWITPRAARRRFSTRFFMAAAPPGAVARADGREALIVQWFNPAQALKRNIPLAHPTRHFLRILAAMNGLDEALAWARGVDRRSIPVTRPEVRRIEGKLMSCLPTGEILGPFSMRHYPADSQGSGFPRQFHSPPFREAPSLARLRHPGSKAPGMERNETGFSRARNSAPARDGAVRPGELVRFTPDIHRLTAFNAGTMTGPGTNTWILGREELAVLDPGPASRRHIDNVLAKAPGRIRWVLATHTHADHSPGAALLARRSGAEIIGPKPPPGERQDQTFRPAHVPCDGEEIKLGGLVLKAVHTPGHASNHFCWWLASRGVLFTGDHVMQGSTVVIAPPDGNMSDYMDSLRRVLELPLKALAPGHGHLIERPRREINGLIAHRQAREDKVARVLAGFGDAAIADLLPGVYDDVPEGLHPIAALSLEAHLNKLEHERKVHRHAGRWRLSASAGSRP